MKKENQRIALTKRLLKESLLELMAEKNIQHITVTELCERAQINRSTFYNHYGCPADVLIDIENGIVADLEKICEQNCSVKNWTMPKRLETLCTYLLEHKKTTKLLLRDDDTNSEFATLLLKAAHTQRIYEESLAHVKDPYTKSLVTTFLSTGAFHMIRQWLLEDIPKTPKEMGNILYHMATRGWETPVDPK